MIDLWLWPYPATMRLRLLWFALRIGSVVSFLLMVFRLSHDFLGVPYKHMSGMITPFAQLGFWGFVYPSVKRGKIQRKRQAKA